MENPEFHKILYSNMAIKEKLQNAEFKISLNLGVVDREWALCMRHQISLPRTL